MDVELLQFPKFLVVLKQNLVKYLTWHCLDTKQTETFIILAQVQLSINGTSLPLLIAYMTEAVILKYQRKFEID